MTAARHVAPVRLAPIGTDPQLAPDVVDHIVRSELIRRENDDAIGRYLSAMRNRWRPGTLRIREGQLRGYAGWLQPTTVVDATEADVMAYFEQLRGKPETINSQISMLRGFYRWMQVYARPRLRDDDPTVLLDRPRIPRRQPRPMLARDYQLALACAASNPTIYAWLGLAGCCGLRCCEIAWLQAVDVEERPDGTGLLHITGKGGHQRTVPAGSDLMLVLRTFVAHAGRGSVFRRPSDGAPHTPNRVSEILNAFLREIGVNATAHQLRHKFGTSYHEIDPDLFRQADLMGHSSINTTRRYTAVSPTEAARHVERLTQLELGGTAVRVGSRPPAPRSRRGPSS